MRSTASSFAEAWDRHAFRGLIAISVLFVLYMACFQKRGGGTFSLEYEYTPLPLAPDDSSSTAGRFRVAPKTSAGERTCRETLQRLFNEPFPNMRPHFLKNAITGRNLEIDCCNLDMRLGVEYNGQQHYKYTPVMHRSKEAFREMQYRDFMKQKLCDEASFTLIVVPFTVPVSDIPRYLEDQLRAVPSERRIGWPSMRKLK